MNNLKVGEKQVSDLSLTRYNAMRQAITEAVRVDEVKDIRDKAEALRIYLKQAGESLEDQNKIAEIKIRAERRAGELLAEMPKASGADYGGKPSIDGNRLLPSNPPPTLADLGISKMQSSRYQTLASIPEDIFEETITQTMADLNELTTAHMLKVANEIKRDQVKKEKMDAPPLEGIYRVWYADPPWHYGNSGIIGETDNYGHVGRHYPSMTIDELCAMGKDIKAHSDDDAILFMWVTSPLLEECFPVIRAWGFQYKTSFVWDKVDHNFGHYNSVRHEFLLVCVRGSCTPDDKTLYDSVLTIQRSDKHSEKPEEFRRLIDSLYTWGNRIELFARTSTNGWDAWGNEA